MSTATPLETAAQVRKAAVTQFEERNPSPEPPTPPTIPASRWSESGMANAWVEVATVSEEYGTPRPPHIQFNLVQRQGSTVTFVEGMLSMSDLDALIAQLQAAKASVAVVQQHLEAIKQYEEQLKTWDRKRGEYAREREAEWQKAAKKG
jgi:hypothetical protein